MGEVRHVISKAACFGASAKTPEGTILASNEPESGECWFEPRRARSSSAVAAGAPCRSTGREDRQARQGSPTGRTTWSRSGPSGWRKRQSRRSLGRRRPAYRRVAAQPLGVFHVLVAGQPPEHRLPQHAGEPMPTVLARARVRQCFGTSVGQVERVIQLAMSQQSGIGGDRRTAKLQQQTTVEIAPQRAVGRFTRRVPHRRPIRSPPSL
jgi:hypothetical protein